MGKRSDLRLTRLHRLKGFAALAGVCMLACLVPARRTLGVEPSEALRRE